MLSIFSRRKKDKELRDFLIGHLQKLKENNINLKEIYEKTKNYSLNKYVKQICKSSDGILKECIKDNSKVSKLNLFINYYQVDVIKILSQYISIKENKLHSDESNEFIEKVDGFIENVSDAFNKMLEDLIAINENSIDDDIKIMLDSLANSEAYKGKI